MGSRRVRRRREGPIRVMYVVPDLGVGGAERHVTLVFPRLDRSRFAPSVVCIGEEGALFPALPAGNVPAVALNCSKREAPKALRQLVLAMRRERPEIVITRGYSAELLGRVAAVIARVPNVIVWVRNNGDLVPRGRVQTVSDRILDRITSAYYGVAYGQIPYMSDDLGYPAEKIRIVYNGADPADYPYDPNATRDEEFAATFGITTSDVVVGILAVLRPEKDHESWLRAAALVAKQRSDTKFLVVGGGPLRERLEALAAELGIADRVIFTGSRSDVGAMLGLMDLFTLASYTIECCPNALLEAMANGRAAVCTAIGGVPEMIAEGVTGYLVPPKDHVGLAAGILEALSDPERLAEMGRAARRRLETEFSLERSVENASAAFEATAGRVGNTAT
jgi:glycosyltransferase involved in cell wall biosynthesis